MVGWSATKHNQTYTQQLAPLVTKGKKKIYILVEKKNFHKIFIIITVKFYFIKTGN